MSPTTPTSRVGLFGAIGLLLLATIGVRAGVPASLSTRSFTNTALGSDPLTLVRTGSTITVDLSAIQGAQVYRATLDPYQRPEFFYDRQPSYFISNSSRARYDIRPPGGSPLELMAPRYLALDATEAVQNAVASGSLTLTIASEGPGLGTTLSLDVLCDRPAPVPVPQVTSAAARHQQGDTMLTFAEINPPHLGATWTVAGYTNALHHTYAPDVAPKRRYRIYRSSQPLTSIAAISGAEFIDEITPMTGWNHGLHSISNTFFSGGDEQYDADIPTLPVNDLMPAAPGTGIYVHRHTGAAGETAHYFISHTVNGAEDFSSLIEGQNATGSVSETPGPGMTLLWREQVFTNGWIFSPDRNPTLRDYVRWEAPPTWNVPSRPMNYRIGLPEESLRVPNPPVTIELHAYFGTFDGWREWRNYEDGALLMTLNLQRYNSYTAFDEAMTTLRSWDDTTVQPYFYARALSFLHDFVFDAYNADQQRLIMTGFSMGGAGTQFWGLRSGHVFAYLAAGVGNSIPAEDITWEFEHWGGYGPLAWQQLYSNQQLTRFGYPVIAAADNVTVWDHFDSVQWLQDHPDAHTPYLTFANAPNDGAIGWPQAWAFARAMADAKRPHNFTWGQDGHGQYYRQNPQVFELDRSLPAFSNCSLDDFLGDTPSNPDPEGDLNRYMRWDDASLVDTTTEWGVDIRLEAGAPSGGATVDVTPRNLQQMSVVGNASHAWELRQGGSLLDSGIVFADGDGIVTVSGIAVSTAPRRILIRPCPGDATGDGMVDFDDLNLVLSGWGSAGPAGDVDGSGVVDFDDLNLVLGSWGALCLP